MLDSIIASINDALYTYILIIALVLGGLYFTFRTKFVQFRMIPDMFRAVLEKPKDKKGVSSFQALMVSTASRVGTGNIVGVSTAICMGGYGAVFWMWVIAIIGSASAFVESTLAQIYKKKSPDGSYGGPAYYIQTALRSRSLAIIFSVLLILTYGVGFNMLASYNLQSTFSGYKFYNESITPWIIGIILAAIVCFCLFGGGKRIIAATSFIVPFMGAGYIIIALVITIINFKLLPGIFKEIFVSAFDFKAIFGGFTGSCVMYGIKRGLFSNEAGVGSAPNASASAEVDHPVKQGLVQILSVFIDTLLVCSATAFMCLASGVAPTAKLSGAPYIQEAVKTTLGAFGPIFITVAMILFAFTTLLGNLFYVEKSLLYIRSKTNEVTKDGTVITKENVAISILLSVLTLGIYNIYWRYIIIKNTKAIARDDSGSFGELMCCLLIPFYALFWWISRGKSLKNNMDKMGYDTTVDNKFYMILFLMGQEMVCMALVQNDFNNIPTTQKEVVPAKKSKLLPVSYIIASLLILLGAGLSADLLWDIADVTMGAMTLINMPVIIILGKYVARALKDYTAQRKKGISPVFKAKNISLPHKTDYWR
ncbi:MAG: amino acid carrier protein [Clostridia bacterium]|nr:amino acid carrier protein [Clostridia bacterium]